MDCGDGCDDGEAESEAVVGRAVVEPLKWLKDAFGVRWADALAGVRNCEVTTARDAVGADPDVTGGNVVTDCVVDEVRDEAFDEHRVARNDGRLERYMNAPVANVGRVEDVFRDRGQIDVITGSEAGARCGRV